MPRAPRDYAVALRTDIERIDAKIRALALERTKKVKMLEEYENTTQVDVSAVLREVAGDHGARARRRHN